MTTIGAVEKSSQLFLEFKYGDPASPTYTRYTQYTMDTILGAFTYTAAPELEIRPPEISGILSDKALAISGPVEPGSFFDGLTNGEPYSPVFVTLWETLKGTAGQPDQTFKLFSGRLARVVRNYQRPKWCMLEVKNIKQRMEIPLGLPANYQCVWTFGGRGCFATPVTSTGTLTVISGKIVTITGLSAQANRFWHRGYVTRLGLSLLIRDWLSGTSFELTREPPAAWAGQSVVVTEGCDKTKETCAAKGLTSQFMGFGFAIPAYSPFYEVV